MQRPSKKQKRAAKSVLQATQFEHKNIIIKKI